MVQRFQCKRCGKAFKEEQPLDGVRIETKKAAQVLAMLFEGIGINAICRLTFLNKRTVLNILESAGEQCARLMDSKVRNVTVKQVAVDEVHSFVARRAQFVEANDPERGAFFCFLSIDRDTKLILNWRVGKRSTEDCRAFMEDLKQRTNGERFQLSTDGYAGYTGHRGAVFQTFRHEIDYGTEVKVFGPMETRRSSTSRVSSKYNPLVCKSVKRTAQIGNPDMDMVNTSHVERLNLTLRLFNRRFTRSTLGFSKTVQNHRYAFVIWAALYNFTRTHSAHGQTPAQAAGITDRKWTIEELLRDVGAF